LLAKNKKLGWFQENHEVLLVLLWVRVFEKGVQPEGLALTSQQQQVLHSTPLSRGNKNRPKRIPR
jgi:hypothetical protein